MSSLENQCEQEMLEDYLKIKNFTKVKDNKFSKSIGSDKLDVSFTKTKVNLKSGSAKVTYDLTISGTRKARELINKAFYF